VLFATFLLPLARVPLCALFSFLLPEIKVQLRKRQEIRDQNCQLSNCAQRDEKNKKKKNRKQKAKSKKQETRNTLQIRINVKLSSLVRWISEFQTYSVSFHQAVLTYSSLKRTSYQRNSVHLTGQKPHRFLWRGTRPTLTINFVCHVEFDMNYLVFPYRAIHFWRRACNNEIHNVTEASLLRNSILRHEELSFFLSPSNLRLSRNEIAVKASPRGSSRKNGITQLLLCKKGGAGYSKISQHRGAN